jgi:hypothetical protein
MRYPNRRQAVLLFDRLVHDLEGIMRLFARIEEMRSDTQSNLPEVNPDRFYRLYVGGEELVLTFEYLKRPCARADNHR